MALKKHMSFTGLTVELFEDVEEVQSCSSQSTSPACIKSHACLMQVLWRVTMQTLCFVACKGSYNQGLECRAS